MTKNRWTKLAAVAAVGTLALTACAGNESSPAGSGGSGGDAKLSGQMKGIGASSMKVAQDTWIKEFQTKNPGVTINYAPEGSGAGREAFMGGGADFAGSDRAFKDEENIAGKFGKCTPESKAYDLPVYVSPIAVVYKVDGVDSLNLDAKTTAGVFSGQIKKWNDPKISALNPGAKLPDANITAVHRSDDSGTTENFTDYLNKVAPDVWKDKAAGEWPKAIAGEAAKGTSGVIAAVKNGANTIGYADESQAGDLKKAKIGENGKYSEITADAAAKVVEQSPRVEGRDKNDMALKLDRKAEGYPIVLVSYALVCADYKDDKTTQMVKSYVGYMGSAEGQQAAQKAAGAAPLSSKLQGEFKTAVDAIK